MGSHKNRLALEQSPYLLQHASNPVDWYPWGDEAFDRARQENKPLFISIGYSTCHWCHVMERESFEDEEVAHALNEAFICVKVDREERPDIDNFYMSVCQGLTGSGGWPLTIVATPDKKPFFAGTYFPKHGRLGRPGLMEIIQSISRVWNDTPSAVETSADEITRAIAGMSTPTESDNVLSVKTLEAGYFSLARAFDPSHGGFSFRPKFPTPHILLFLLRYCKRTGERESLAMAERTLREMRSGGIFDHIGYGFHRYSTDENWLVPHFEKMLYDQALLTLAYVETFQVTGDPFYAEVAHEILQYVLRDLTSPDGGFYSAEDADSEGVEGKFYVWSMQEVKELLGDESNLFLKAYNFGSDGNYAEESTGELTGVNIPHLARPLGVLAGELGVSETDVRERLDRLRRTLFQKREQRIRPLKDDKILTDWNGLMIAAMARAGRVLDELKYTDAAVHAADFILSRIQDSNGRLLKRFRNGNAALPGMLDDYAFFCWGLLEVYEAVFDSRMLAESLRISRTMIEHFHDATHGGFFISPDDGEPLPIRAKEAYDGATPSGNSVAALVLNKLARLTGEQYVGEIANKVFQAFNTEIASRPSNFTFMLTALDFALGPPTEIVIAGKEDNAVTAEMVRTVQKCFLPNSVLILRSENTAKNPIPVQGEQFAVQDAPAVYICHNYACRSPITEIDELQSYLSEM